MKRIGFMMISILLLLPLHSFAVTKPVESVPITKENVQMFSEDYFTKRMEENQIPGAVMIVVKDNEILYEQGFGFANLEKGLEVDPSGSLFRIGSVTKLFTATAIMQLVELGLVDVEANVNDYLTDFQIDTKDFQPVRVKHLLTHTAGFDELIIGMAAEHYRERKPLRNYLKENQPKMLREPGQYIQYSNYGMGLLGLVIEEVSGLSYEQYIEDHILKPLGMNDTHVVMNPTVYEQLAREYFPIGDGFKEEPLYDFHFPPAGSVLATAEDMAQFMLLHLNNGTWNGATVINENTAKLMHERQFSQHPSVQGFGFSFFERLQNSHRFLEHGGNTGGTNSMLMIDKDRNIGVFIANNGYAGALMTAEFPQTFINHFYPISESAAVIEDLENIIEETNLKRYEGSYYTNRYSREDVSKITLALSPSIKISQGSNRSLLVQFLNQERRFIQVEPLVFFDPKTVQYIAFEEDGKGNITHMFDSSSFVFEKGSWYQNVLLHGILIGLFFLLSVGTGLILIVKLIKKIVKRKKESSTIVRQPSWYKNPGKLNILICMSFLLYLAVLLIGISQMDGIVSVFLDLPLAVQLALYIPVLTILLVIIQGVVLLKSWFAKSGGPFVKQLYYTAVLFLAVSVVLVLRYYNLVASL
ncbi:serine hydrolase domain-containing protein [Bacillus sp. B15-48]|uniref:serine hydrolase domain-containing protein n=1 Tax=Bacillus sp. B15-48 TaxID=1548601 RepID=UPI001EF1AB6D|nr:serine hydrolase domain-containing protein [Bacillus sp. B15-48]